MKVENSSKVKLNVLDLDRYLKKLGAIPEGSSLIDIRLMPNKKELELAYDLPVMLSTAEDSIVIVDELKNEFLNSKVKDLHLRSMVLTGLSRTKIDTVKDLLEYSPTNLMKFRLISKKAIDEISKVLQVYGLNLAPDL